MKYISTITLVLFYSIFYAEEPTQNFSYQAYDNRSDTLDIVNTIINFDFGNYTSRNVIAHSSIVGISKQNNLNKVRFDLRGLTIDSIKTNGISSSYIISSQSLVVNFPLIFNNGDNVLLDFYYHGTPFLDINDFGGFYWSNNYAYNIGVSFLEEQHSYGRTWFPCFDNFVERCTFEYFITTDSTRKAFCGGNLLNTIINSDGSITWHWKNNQNIPSYLASVAVAKYATLEDTFNGIERIIPIQLGVLASDSNKLKGSFANLDNALRIFENSYGPYKFDRVGYAVTDYNGGAMEHACNITYPNFAVNGNLSYETLMAHELSHHWWGDLVTCENASEMWLNEGWAVYSEHVFTEGMYGKDAYKKSVRDNHASVLQFAHVRDSGYLALSSVPNHLVYGSTSYKKGADIAHSLRGYMGDTLFFNVLKDYMNSKAFTNVKSTDFRDFITSNSSFNASDFFNDWVLSPGFPQFSIDYHTYSSGQLRLWIKQRLDNAPHYYKNVPMGISVFDNNFNKTTFKVNLSEICSDIVLNIGFEPSYIALDFDEKISDAIIDEYQTIKTTGTKSFLLAKAIIDTRVVGADSILMRVEHNYVAPDPMKAKIPGLHLHNYRYWNIDGIFDDALTKANVSFNYNGTNSLTNGYLDNDFITNSEDSIVLMYRKNALEDWRIFDSTRLYNNGNAFDKNGRVVAYNLKKGQYCFAIYDFRYEDTTYYQKNCNALLINEFNNQENNITIYPNPANNQIKLTIEKPIKNAVIRIYTMNGEIVKNIEIINSNEIIIDTKSMNNSVYIIKYFNEKEVFTSKFEVLK
jgi:aminopeptidase N